jgi:GNAT superfamily N-acetyltransferase
MDTIDITVTYLEMTTPPLNAPSAANDEAQILLVERPTVSFYRYLYETVGEAYLWYERRGLDDETLRRIIHDPGVALYVLYVGGVPAGYSELDGRRHPDVELSYFGLIPEFLGRGLGPYLLRRTIAEAWARKPSRLWVHTCTLDHPSAMDIYRRAGFKPYRREKRTIADPRLSGLFRGQEKPAWEFSAPGSG